MAGDYSFEDAPASVLGHMLDPHADDEVLLLAGEVAPSENVSKLAGTANIAPRPEGLQYYACWQRCSVVLGRNLVAYSLEAVQLHS